MCRLKTDKIYWGINPVGSQHTIQLPDVTNLIEAAEKVCIDNEGKQPALLTLRGIS